MNRTFAIGDLHGGLKALKQLLQRINLKAEDRLIFLGDYVDGWSDTANVISYLINLSKKYECIFIRGNHDDLTQHWLETGDFNPTWLDHGGQSTMEAYERFSEKEKKQHLKFLQQTLNYYVDEENRLFVHAGFTNLHGPEREYYETSFYWDRSLWEMVLALDASISTSNKRYPKRLQHFKEIFIGHTPVTRIGQDKPVNIANVWNVDTGAAFKGKISALEVNTKEIWQSDPVFELYPHENGRN